MWFREEKRTTKTERAQRLDSSNLPVHSLRREEEIKKMDSRVGSTERVYNPSF
jgi:hypothetical protein